MPLPVDADAERGEFLAHFGQGSGIELSELFEWCARSGGAGGRAATTATAQHLRAAGERTLTLFATRVAKNVVV